MISWCHKTGLARVVAICEQDEQVVGDLKRKFPQEQINYDRAFDAFLARDMDAVVLANYATEHAPYAIRCLEAGRHVLSEVLPCQTLDEAVRLVEAVERSGRVYAYAENYCYMAAPREMRKLYRAGRLGEFEYGEGEYVHNCEPIWPDITYGERGHWRNFMYATFYCTHSLGPVLHITGLRPVRVTGFELPFTDRCARMGKRGGVAGVEMVTLENGGVVRSLHGDLDKDSIRYVLYGSKGRMESAAADARTGGVERIYTNLDEREGVYLDEPKSYLPTDAWSEAARELGHGGSDYYVMRNFIDAVQGKPAEIIGVYEALDMFLPGLLAHFSVLAGGAAQEVPNLREEGWRARCRGDHRCCDERVAGEQLLPSYSKCEVEIPDAVYESVRREYLDRRKN